MSLYSVVVWMQLKIVKIDLFIDQSLIDIILMGFKSS
jgi:hypothetical protein